MMLARIIWVVAATIALLGASTARAGEPVSGDDITVHVDTRGSTVIIDVEVPMSVSPEEAWPTLTDYDHMSDFLPNLTQSRVLERDGNRLRVVQKGNAKRGAFSFAFENVREVMLLPPHEIRTRLVSGSLKSSDSVTRIEPTATGLRLVNHGEYTVSALLPVGLVTNSIASETREQFALMRAEIMRRHAQVASAR